MKSYDTQRTAQPGVDLGVAKSNGCIQFDLESQVTHNILYTKHDKCVTCDTLILNSG